MAKQAVAEVRLQDIIAEPQTPPKGLVENIRKYGLINPVCLLDSNNGHYRIIAGRKRVAAASEVGLTEIPATILNSDACEEIVALSENYHRSPSPALEAEMFKRLMDAGLTQQEVAKTLNISQGQVSQRLRILSLIPEFLAMLRSGELRPCIAYELAGLDEETQRKLLAEEKLTLGLVRDVKRQKKLGALEMVPVESLPAPPLRPRVCPHCGMAIEEEV